MPVDSHTSSGDGSSSPGEAEVQSEYRGFCSSSLGTSPPKKGLSRFYVGKSRSFSCLRDVVSVKDLPKPENPYAKKRKCNVGRSLHARPQLPPLQKGLASISKKLPCNAKSTLAWAVATSAKDEGMEATCEKDFQKSSGFGRVSRADTSHLPEVQMENRNEEGMVCFVEVKSQNVGSSICRGLF
ncbi:hypothetical protein GOP47_0006149 [Adiantum capillus-veneris]|uniref:Uncharacterized protein n=1 Tax=Adiantum capillus-veneris TaxID=13818 RepID=A0A9D4V2I5_ADICA|nr:hypothetical protein GOP47_0006149 [Adiantum capillus-veneris]